MHSVLSANPSIGTARRNADAEAIAERHAAVHLRRRGTWRSWGGVSFRSRRGMSVECVASAADVDTGWSSGNTSREGAAQVRDDAGE